MACDRQPVALREDRSWAFAGNCRTAVKRLGQLLTKDFRTIDRRVLSALGIDPKTRKERLNAIRPGEGKIRVDVRQTRIINRALAMELLVSALLTCLDGPDEVKSWCTVSIRGEPNNFAPGPYPDIVGKYKGFCLAVEVSCKRDARNPEFFKEQLEQAVRHAAEEATRPGAGRVYAVVITGCSVEDNRRMRRAYMGVVGRTKETLARSRQAGQKEPDIRLVPVKSAVFSGICEQIFGSPGASGAGLGITSAALAKALDDVHEGLQAKRDIDQEHWMYSTLMTALRERAEEQLPIGG